MKPSRIKLPTTAITPLDFLRGIAAFAVLVGHVRGVFFIDYEKLSHPSILMKGLYFATGLGHQAVVVFFALSGFFVGTSVLTAQRDWSWSSYLIRRFTRLYVVLVPALLITAALDVVGMRAFGAVHNIYTGQLSAPYLSLNDVRETCTPSVFSANLLFLQTMRAKTFGSNDPLWSLSYEFWSYILFPLLMRTFARNGHAGMRVLYLALAAAIGYLGGLTFLGYFLMWTMGAAVAAFWHRLPGVPQRLRVLVWPVLAIVFLVALAYARLRHRVGLAAEFRADLLLCAATSVLILYCLTSTSANTSALSKLYVRAASLLAGFSYTLYVVHFPILVLLQAATRSNARWSPDATHLAIGASIAMGVVVLVAYPLARATEGRTELVRRWVSDRLRVVIPQMPS